MELARCGLDCGTCTYRESEGCEGCHAYADGVVFWGTCDVAACAIARDVRDCSACPELPCALLHSMAYDEEQGDDGQRIRNLEAKRERG